MHRCPLLLMSQWEAHQICFFKGATWANARTVVDISLKQGVMGRQYQWDGQHLLRSNLGVTRPTSQNDIYKILLGGEWNHWECRHPKWLYFFRGAGIPPTGNKSAVGFRQFLVSVKFLLGRNESHHDCMLIGQFCSPTLGRFWRLHLLQGHQLDSKQIHQAHHDTHSCICFSHFSHLIVLLSHSFHFLMYQFYWVIFTSLPSLFPKLSPAGCRMSIERSGIHIFPA